MSRAYNDHIDELNDQRERDHIASSLSVDLETLDDYPYTLDHQTTNDGMITALIVSWDDKAPPSVTPYSDAGSLWSSIPPMSDGDADYEPSDDE